MQQPQEPPMTRTLLVIDIQNEYFAGGLLPLWKSDEVEAGIVSAIARAKALGDQIILVRHVSNAAAGLFSANGAGSAIRPAILAAAADAPVVIKHVADAFQDTDLSSYLADTRELLICGMMTQNCVVFTALSRAANDLSVRVVGDLCTAPTEIVHNIALNSLGSKGLVTTAAELWPA
jgi:nicotinamidase-related amidase